jgi:NAD(P)-dependent dehydrogenase (short-subunit alcohol dehydrogenase family)
MSGASEVWFITGASSGFGLAFAEHALERGYNVVVGARRTDKLQEIASLFPGRVLAVPLDVNNPEQVSYAARATLERFGKVDVLINNAGYGIVGAIEETSEQELRAQMETNFFGAIAVTRAFVPSLRKQKSGAIVNSSSLGASCPSPALGRIQLRSSRLRARQRLWPRS